MAQDFLHYPAFTARKRLAFDNTHLITNLAAQLVMRHKTRA